MKRYTHHKRILGGMVFGLFMITGTYNAVVINSESYISGQDVRLVKRLDEVYGVVKPGRLVASSMKWQKLTPVQATQVKQKFIQQASRPLLAQPQTSERQPESEVVAQAAVQEELSLKLVEVMNPKKWSQGLNQSHFTGSLSTRDGVIEDLSVSLPNDEGLTVAFSGLTGNVFQYEANGESYSGMMYQVDQNSYKVNITSGPLEGTIMTFAAEPSVEQLAMEEQHQIQMEQNREEVALASEDPNMGMNVENNQEQAPEQESAYGTFGDPQLPVEAQQAFAQDQAATQAALMQAQAYAQENQAEPIASADPEQTM